jgi:hypothetical protein
MNIGDAEAPARLYLDLIKKCLTRHLLRETHFYLPALRPAARPHPLAWAAFPMTRRLFAPLGLTLCRRAL